MFVQIIPNKCSALISRRAPYPRLPCPVRVVTTRKTSTQTRRACATCAPITDEAKPKYADTLCPPFSLSLSCKRTSCSRVTHLEFIQQLHLQ